MNPVPKFRECVLAIATKYGIDLDIPGTHLRLEQEQHGILVIENIGGSRISVSNYVRVGDDSIADPEIVVYVAHVPHGQDCHETPPNWYPIEMDQFFGGWQLSAELDLHGELVVYDLKQQAEIARTVETVVASMLAIQDWLNAGRLAQGSVYARGPEEVWNCSEEMAEMDDVPF